MCNGPDGVPCPEIKGCAGMFEAESNAADEDIECGGV